MGPRRGLPRRRASLLSAPTTPPADAEPLQRSLGVTGLWLLAINGMIGAGIFGIPAAAQALAGDFSPWLFVLCALLIAPIVLCFGELASGVRGSGGPAVYLATAFGPFAGFQAGWAFYVARLTAFAANLNLLVLSLGHLLPGADGSITRLLLLALGCAALVWVNVVGARTAMASLGLLTLAKLLPLLLLAGVGSVQLDQMLGTTALQPPPPAVLGEALLLVIYAYVGFESSVVPGGEARQPQRDMPRALLLALLVATALYALVQLAAQQLVPDLASSERPLVDAGQALAGQPGAWLILLGILASVGGNLLGSMFSTARVSFRLARDGQLPAWFGRVDQRHGTPANSILCFGLLAFLLAASGSFVWLAVLSVLTRLLLYLGSIASMPAARRQPGIDGQWRLRGGYSLPLLAMLVCLALLTQVQLSSVLATAALLAVGSLLYLARRH